MPGNQEYLIKIYFMEIIFFFHTDDFYSTIPLWNYWRGGQSDQVHSEERNRIHYLKRKFNIKNNELGIKLNGILYGKKRVVRHHNYQEDKISIGLAGVAETAD